MSNLLEKQMEREITPSTAEAEYIALSMCCRQLIPLRTILAELAQHLRSPIPGLPICNPNSTYLTRLGNSQIMEDNSAALIIANDADDRYRPRTKHLCIKWHHFPDHVRRGSLSVKKIASKDNISDIFTKPLPRPQFCALRDILMGWKRPEKPLFP